MAESARLEPCAEIAAANECDKYEDDGPIDTPHQQTQGRCRQTQDDAREPVNGWRHPQNAG